MTERVAQIYIDSNDDGEMLSIEWSEAVSLKEQLGILEWAKSIILESVKMENALADYGVEES